MWHFVVRCCCQRWAGIGIVGGVKLAESVPNYAIGARLHNAMARLVEPLDKDTLIVHATYERYHRRTLSMQPGRVGLMHHWLHLFHEASQWPNLPRTTWGVLPRPLATCRLRLL